MSINVKRQKEKESRRFLSMGWTKNKRVDRMTIKELYEYAKINGFENLPFRKE